MRNLLMALLTTALLVLIATGPGWLHPPAAQSAPLPGAARTLARGTDPVIVTGQQMPAFISAPLDKLFVYAYTGGVWHQIPWQFDEIKNGQYVTSDNGLLDNADQLVVMAGDSGDQAPADNWISDRSANSYPRYEILITDPLNPGKQGWIYVYRSNTLTETVSAGYVSFNAAETRFTTSSYVLGLFPDRIGASHLDLNGSRINGRASCPARAARKSGIRA